MKSAQVLLIAKYSARFAVRGGVGLVFLLLALTFGLMVAHLMMQPVEMGARLAQEHAGSNADAEQAQRRAMDELMKVARPAVSWVLSRNRGDEAANAAADSWADYLLIERPALLSAIFLILLWGWPFLVACGAFDLYAGDIASRQLRYQLLRADRSSIFFGRLLGSLVTFVLVLALLAATVAVYMGLKLPLYDWGSLLGWSFYGFLALVVVSLPYVALCSWISASIGGSFTSLTIVSLVIGGLPLLATIGRMTHEAADYVLYVLPWGFQSRLFHPEPSQIAVAVVGCLLQAGLYGWLGHRKFCTRDL